MQLISFILEEGGGTLKSNSDIAFREASSVFSGMLISLNVKKTATANKASVTQILTTMYLQSPFAICGASNTTTVQSRQFLWIGATLARTAQLRMKLQYKEDQNQIANQ